MAQRPSRPYRSSSAGHEITKTFQLAMKKKKKARGKRGFWGKVSFTLRRRILTGVLVMSPIIISFLPVILVAPYIRRLAEAMVARDVLIYDLESFQGKALTYSAAVFVVLAALYLIGLLSSTFVWKWTIGIGEKVIAKIPFIDFFYGTTKQVAEIIQSGDGKPFQKAVIVEYPRKGVFSMGFVTGEADYPGRLGPMVHVFMPTTPNPTSGFLLLYPAEDILETNLDVDEAVKFIISGGIIALKGLHLRPYTGLRDELERAADDED